MTNEERRQMELKLAIMEIEYDRKLADRFAAYLATELEADELPFDDEPYDEESLLEPHCGSCGGEWPCKTFACLTPDSLVPNDAPNEILHSLGHWTHGVCDAACE